MKIDRFSMKNGYLRVPLRNPFCLPCTVSSVGFTHKNATTRSNFKCFIPFSGSVATPSALSKTFYAIIISLNTKNVHKNKINRRIRELRPRGSLVFSPL